MSRKRSKELVPCLYCSKLFHQRYDLIQRGMGKFCSIQCANWVRRTKVDEAAIVSEYQMTRIGVKSLAKKYRLGQYRAYAILHKHQVDTSVGKRRNANGSASQTYRKIAATVLGRPLKRTEYVHHIDGDRTNNLPNNLHVMTGPEHRRLHWTIEKATFELVKTGLMIFDPETMEYTISPKLRTLMEK